MFSAHVYPMVTRSAYFFEMLSTAMQEMQKREIQLPTLSKPAVDELLKYLYRENEYLLTNVTLETLQQLHTACDL